MQSKMMASRQYTANQFGMSSGPKRPKKNKNKDQGQDMSCSEHGCAAFDSGGGGSNAGSKGYVSKTSSSTSSRGGKNVVLKPGSFKAKRHARKLAKVRENAPAMNNLTRKQKEDQNEMRPSRQDFTAPKASAKPAAQPKKTKKITF